MTNDFPKIVWHNFRQKPILDRVFYVPFWDCPYNCDFCCVDSLPGKPKVDFEEGKKFLLNFLKSFHSISKKPIALHYYGGEPLLKPQEFLDIVKMAQDSKIVSKIYLYSTLLPKGSLEVIKMIPKDFIRVIVNEFTADQNVINAMKELDGIAEYYDNPVVFHTGRARQLEQKFQGAKNFSNKKIKQTVFENIFPASFPGRSCFANASGPLINLAHKKIHLCCLPQSPVIGDFDTNVDELLIQYKIGLESFYKKTTQAMKDCGDSHACKSCEKWSQWDTKKESLFNLPI